jgi:hypothetical protein
MNIEKEIADATAYLESDDLILEFSLVGSALYREDAKDVDFVVLVAKVVDYWPALGTWAKCSDSYDLEAGWLAIRQGNLNLLITDSMEWFKGCETASHVCAALGLTKKSDRVRVHRVVRDGMDFEEARDAPMRDGVHD